jgi:uncharacterized protein YbaR (Trm112 family)
MDTLVCSEKECRNELNLKVFEAHQVELENEQIEEIDEALLTCPKCGRWYPVIDGIACILTDNLRMTGKQHVEETRFLERWKEQIDSAILESGNPFGLVS